MDGLGHARQLSSESVPESGVHARATNTSSAAPGGRAASRRVLRPVPDAARACGDLGMTIRDRLLQAWRGHSAAALLTPGSGSPFVVPTPVEGSPVRRSNGGAGAGALARFLALAEEAGFVVVARFTAEAEHGPPETLSVLYLPAGGILMEVVSAGPAVLDARIHYNVHTDDAAALQAAFEEHRDVESQTLYVRQSYPDDLLAACRRLRAEGRLVAEWRVSPFIYLLTPGEWSSMLSSSRGRGDARTLSVDDIGRERIDRLPADVLERTGLDLACVLSLKDRGQA